MMKVIRAIRGLVLLIINKTLKVIIPLCLLSRLKEVATITARFTQILLNKEGGSDN